jgi:hypothetical protein
VIFYKESAYYPWHLPADVDLFAVHVDAHEMLADPSVVMRTLRNVSDAEVHAKQEMLAMLSDRIQTSASSDADGLPDAFAITLAGLLQSLKQERKL